MRAKILARIIWLFYYALKSTWRIQLVEHEDFQSDLKNNRMAVLAHWHGDELAVIHLITRYRGSAITSTSKDGEIINSFLNLLGVPTARGSSTRGAVGALKGIIRLAKLNFRPTFAVDGPKGPYHKVKPGALELAKLLDCPIYPCGAAADRAFIFHKAWNKTYLPKPFAKVVIVWGPPVKGIPRDADLSNSPFVAELEKALLDAGQKASNLIAGN